MKYLIFDDYESANRWRRSHDFIGQASQHLQIFFFELFGSASPYPNDKGTVEFTSVMDLNGGRYINQGQALGGYCVQIYDHIYHGLINKSLWDETCNILATPELILDDLEIEHLAI